jgi:hypothetical protein
MTNNLHKVPSARVVAMLRKTRPHGSGTVGGSASRITSITCKSHDQRDKGKKEQDGGMKEKREGIFLCVK